MKEKITIMSCECFDVSFNKFMLYYIWVCSLTNSVAIRATNATNAVKMTLLTKLNLNEYVR